MPVFTWNTDKEIEFVSRIGKHSKVGKRFPRRTLLERYLQSTKLRVRWNGVNKERVVEATLLMLAEEIRKEESDDK
jgi:hypothetical protein